MNFENIIEKSKEYSSDLYKTALALEVEKSGKTEEELLSRMQEMWLTMKQSVEKGTQSPIQSKSGMTGGEGYNLYNKANSEYTTAAAMAMGVANINSAMGRIVAAPTAGACGILPGVLCTMQKRTDASDEKMAQSLFVSGFIGEYIAETASIAGARHGCQAECGSGSAMAAAAGVWLSGGSIKQSLDAASMTLKAIMGLVCDPVAGLVEVPCIKRNAFGAVEALLAIDMAMAGIESVIPFDETVLAMKDAGDMMNDDLKETSRAGLAQTKTGKKWTEKM